MSDSDIESRILEVRQRLDSMLRDLRSGGRRKQTLIKLLGIAGELSQFVLESTGDQIRKDSRP